MNSTFFSRCLKSSVALILFVAGMTSGVHAQAYTDGEELRSDLLTVVSLYEQVAPPDKEGMTLPVIGQTRLRIEGATAEELDAMMQVMSKEQIEKLISSLNVLQQLKTSDESAARSLSITPNYVDPGNGGGGGEDPGDLPAPTTCHTARYSTILMQAALNVYITAEIVKEVASRICNEDVAGFNLSLGCILSDGVFFIAKFVYENIELCEGDIDSNEIHGSYVRLGSLQTSVGNLGSTSTSISNTVGSINTRTSSMNSTVNAINSAAGSITTKVDGLSTTIGPLPGKLNTLQADLSFHDVKATSSLLNLLTSTSAINTTVGQINTTAGVISAKASAVQSDLAAHDTAVLAAVGDQNSTISAALEKFKTLTLRISIEKGLAANEHKHPISLFLLPEAHGGYLEVVRAIVTETIDNMRAAGMKIREAEKKLAKGDEKFAVGDYKKAYKNFADAYRHAVR